MTPMPQYSLIDALKDNPMFIKLDDYSYQIIENYLSFKALDEGDILFNEGDRGDFMAIIVAGSLDILKKINPITDESKQQLPVGTSLPTNTLIKTANSDKTQNADNSIAFNKEKSIDNTATSNIKPITSAEIEPLEKMTRLSVMYEGDSIGEMSIIDELPRSATVRALERTGIIILQKKDFDRILENYPRIGIKMLKGITTKLSINLRRTSDSLSKARS